MELKNGIYLIVDPAMDEKILLKKIDQIVGSPIVAVQIWDNFQTGQSIEPLVWQIHKRCSPAGIPVIINNRWEYLQHTPLDGVHFDQIPQDLPTLRAAIARPFITGLTCNNDLSVVQWAADYQLAYISFCSMFPSPTANSCELVDFQTVREARQLFKNHIFLAGGIRPHNLHQLTDLHHDGIAVVSGVMDAEHPAAAIQRFYQNLTFPT